MTVLAAEAGTNTKITKIKIHSLCGFSLPLMSIDISVCNLFFLARLNWALSNRYVVFFVAFASFSCILLSATGLVVSDFEVKKSCVVDRWFGCGEFFLSNICVFFWDLSLLFSRFVFVCVSLSAVAAAAAQGVYAVEHYTNAIRTIQHCCERYMMNIGFIVYFTCELNGVRVTKIQRCCTVPFGIEQ